MCFFCFFYKDAFSDKWYFLGIPFWNFRVGICAKVDMYLIDVQYVIQFVDLICLNVLMTRPIFLHWMYPPKKQTWKHFTSTMNADVFFNVKLGIFQCHVSELRVFLSNASKGQRLHHRADSLCWCQLHPFGHGGHAPNRQPGSATTGARMWRMGARRGGRWADEDWLAP